MKKIILLVFAVISFNDSFCQEEEPVMVAPPPVSEKGTIRVGQDVVEFPEVEAEFVGGADSLRAYIRRNVKYPDKAILENTQGKVYLSFIVEKDGAISNVKIIHSVSPELDSEAKRLIRSMPKWHPGRNNGEACRTRCNIPINFMFLPVASWSQTETMEELLSEHDSLFIVNFELNEELGYLAEQVELLKVSYETQKNTLQSLVELKKENEKLREIMRDYINQISELNTININLESDKIYLQEKLDKCAETK